MDYSRLLLLNSGGFLSSATANSPAPPDALRSMLADKRRRSFVLVVLCTLVGAAAQIFIKSGASTLAQPGLMGAVVGMVTNPALFVGYCMYGFNAVLMVLALRDGELSMLYPIIALTYVWVTLLSMWVFHEPMSIFKSLGVTLIITGVGILGRGKSS
jgi:multidrug transporter EmrE-like cation transporter